MGWVRRRSAAHFAALTIHGLADPKGWGDLIQIADPDISSNPAKEEIAMSEVIALISPTDKSVECVLSASDSFIETLSIQAIDALPGVVELVIKSQLLSARNPAEKRVKSRTNVDLMQLADLHRSIGEFLTAQQNP